MTATSGQSAGTATSGWPVKGAFDSPSGAVKEGVGSGHGPEREEGDAHRGGLQADR